MSTLFASNNKADFSGPPAIDATGTYSDATRVPYAMIVPNSGNIAMVGDHMVPAATIVWYHYHLIIKSGYASYVYDTLLIISDAAGNEICHVSADGGLLKVDANGDTLVFGAKAGPLLNGGIAVTIDVKVTANATSIITDLYADSVLISSATAANTAGKGVGSSIRFMSTGDSGYYFSEVIIADADTRGLRLTRIDPTAVGNYTAWVGGFAQLGDDSLTTAASTPTPATRVSSVLATYGGSDAINSVVSSIRAAAATGAPTGVASSLRVGTVDYDAATILPTKVELAYAQEWTVDPSDGLAWTAAKVNATQLGLLSVA